MPLCACVPGGRVLHLLGGDGDRLAQRHEGRVGFAGAPYVGGEGDGIFQAEGLTHTKS